MEKNLNEKKPQARKIGEVSREGVTGFLLKLLVRL